MTPNNQTAKIQGKTLIVNQENHKSLTLMKIEGNYKSIDEVIGTLLKSWKKEKKNGK